MLSLAAAAVLQRWVSWPVTPSQITIPATSCPDTPTGPQTFEAALRAAEWEGLFTLVFVLSAFTALAVVAATYQTRKIGLPFVTRWSWFLVLSFGAALVVSLVMLRVVPVSTSGCEQGETVAYVPWIWVVLRSVLAGVHGVLFYLLWSCLLALVLGRFLRLGRWYDNHLVPLPYFRSRPRG